MSEKSAINQMVEWLDKRGNSANEAGITDLPHSGGAYLVGETLREALEEARRLALEEAKDEPTNYEEWRNTLTDEQRKESDKELAELVAEHNKPPAPASLGDAKKVYLQKSHPGKTVLLWPPRAAKAKSAATREEEK